jgi:hypothetical protein
MKVSTENDNNFGFEKITIVEFIKYEKRLRKEGNTQGLYAIPPPLPTLKTTREESRMSNFHTTLFQNSFVLVS